MMDLLFQAGLSNAFFALVLATAAMAVSAKARRPHLAHMLWLLVFIKLVTPPILMIPIEVSPAPSHHTIATNDTSEPDVTATPSTGSPTLTSSAWSDITGTALRARPCLGAIWVLGAAVVLAWSMARVYRFDRLLAAESRVAPETLQTAAELTARRLGLRTIPVICTTSSHLSPMVWWTGGHVRVILPSAMLVQMEAGQWQWILAHELAHVQRRDYLIRWLEWLACACFWWNPVVWWAQRNLRAAEEICCDELVLSRLHPKPKCYANCLLAAVEFLARPALRAPAMASEINSGGVLERRFKMIVSGKPNRRNSRRLQVCVLLAAMVVLPLGVASAQDYKAVAKRLQAAVAAGELTGEQARTMLATLPNAGADKKEVDGDAAAKRIRTAVQAGKMTREEARSKMAAIKKEATEKAPEPGRARARLMEMRKDLEAAVRAGRISKEAAIQKFREAEKKVKESVASGREADQSRVARKDSEGIEARQRKTVAEGKISPERVRARLQATRKAPAQQNERGPKVITKEDIARAEAKLRKAVAEGKITAERARARLQNMRSRMADQNKSSREIRDGNNQERETVVRRLRTAVAEGKMTREEAREKLKAYRERKGQ